MIYWRFKRKYIKSLEDMPEGVFGFVYIIKNKTNGKFYIGKKQILSNRKVKLGKRELEKLKDKRLKKYKIVTKESNWKTYTGSCKALNEDIKNGHELEKIILDFATDKKHLTYLEVKHQFKNDVLERDDSYNDNILAKFYKDVR